MANWSEGLNRLGQGLGTLAQHAIYKDEVARKERLEAAQQQYQERLLALKERTSEAQISQGQQRLDIAGEQNEFMRDYHDRSLDLREGEVTEAREHRQWQRERAEQQDEMLRRQAEMTGYTDRLNRAEDRAQELNDQLGEIMGDLSLGDDARNQRAQHIQKQLDDLATTETRAAFDAGLLTDKDFTDEQHQIISHLQNTSGLSKPGAVVAMSRLGVEELRELAEYLELDLGFEMAEAPKPTPSADPKKERAFLGNVGDVAAGAGDWPRQAGAAARTAAEGIADFTTPRADESAGDYLMRYYQSLGKPVTAGLEWSSKIGNWWLSTHGAPVKSFASGFMGDEGE